MVLIINTHYYSTHLNNNNNNNVLLGFILQLKRNTATKTFTTPGLEEVPD